MSAQQNGGRVTPAAASLHHTDTTEGETATKERNQPVRSNHSTQTATAPVAPAILTMGRFDKSWPPKDGEQHVPQSAVPLQRALGEWWHDDKHFAAYEPVPVAFPDGKARPARLNSAAVQRDVAARMRWLVFDVDAPEHVATPEWRADVEARIPAGVLWYPTNGGMRLIYDLGQPFEIKSTDDAAAWEDYYLTACNALQRMTGIAADRGCKDWTRLHRLPRVTRRDGTCPVPAEWQPTAPLLWQDEWLTEADLPTDATPARAIGSPDGDVADTLLFRVLEAAGWEFGYSRGEWTDVACPWEAEHTTHNPSSTSIKGNDDLHSTGPGVFRCQHSHCRGRTVKDVLAHPTFAPIVAQLDAQRAEQRRQQARDAGLDMGPANDNRPTAAGVVAPAVSSYELGQDATVNELIANLSQPKLGVYQRAGHLCVVARDACELGGVVRPAGAPTIKELQPARLREIIRTLSGPRDVQLAPEVLARGEWAHIRPLDAIVTYPIMRRDGTILLSNGYDAATRTLAEIDVQVSVSDAPTQAEAAAALTMLKDLVSDFPFVSDAQRCAWLAMLLTVPARPAIDGPTPLGLLEASQRGSGKSKLADVISVITTGREAPRRVAPKTKEEWDKTMLTILLAGDPVVLFDNIVTMLASDALDAVLTGTSYAQRVLGETEERRVAVRTVFLASCNNARLSSDLVRRSIACRLEPAVERPEERTDFRHPDLLAHVRANRAALLGAALTILRGYAAAGRPRVAARPMGSYESWCRVVRDALVWAGGTDPVITQDSLRETADIEQDELRALLTAWHAALGGEAVTVRGLLEAACGDMHNPAASALLDALRGVMPNGAEPTSHGLGNRLRSFRGQIVGGLVLRDGKADSRNHTRTWQVVKI